MINRKAEIEKAAKAIARIGADVIWGEVKERHHAEPDMTDMRNLATAGITPLLDRIEALEAALDTLELAADAFRYSEAHERHIWETELAQAQALARAALEQKRGV